MKRVEFRAIGIGPLAGVVLLALGAAGLNRPAAADEYMFMPTLGRHHTFGSTDDPTVEKRQILADFFYAGDKGRLRLLSELQIERETWDMERLQVGWRLAPSASLWFGRYHSPIGFWNVEHHHGHFMETSAQRPAILDFEDEGGPLPIHLAGFLIQGTHAIGAASLQYDVGVGGGPRIMDGEMEPIDVIRAPRRNKLATVARIAYRPDAAMDDQLGLFAARTRIPIEAETQSVVEQSLWGLYFSREFSPVRLFGELFRIRHRDVSGAAVGWPSYWAGYVQAEYKLVPSVLTLFGRHEGMSSRLDDGYTALFPKLPKERHVAGVRWDVIDNHALKLEFVRNRTIDGLTFNGFEVQWSAMFH